MMRTMFEGLLSDWDSEGYAKTYNVPSRATLQLQLYQIWPEVHFLRDCVPSACGLMSDCRALNTQLQHLCAGCIAGQSTWL